jgi:UDP-N-acetyl-D-glucosamine dehydrogenase
VPEIPPTREYQALKGRKSVELTSGAIAGYDAVLVATDHDRVDYADLLRNAALIVDTRNVFGRLGLSAPHVVKA